MNINTYQDHCCGCGECYAICSVNAITMQKNKQGFLYPVIDEKTCIHCGKCISRCSFNSYKGVNEVVASYALKHTDPGVRAASRSGGFFTALSDLVLDMGGVVYGVELRNCREAVHIRAVTKEERDACRGSKYIQSKIYDMFGKIKEDLQNGMWVLFTGTACQVSAVADYCRSIDCSRLLLVDIICYGVPSRMVWEDYLAYISDKYKKKIKSVEFRDKAKFGWAAHKETFEFEDGTFYHGDCFAKLFGKKYILREACFSCPFKSTHRVGDISIGDCWGIEKQSIEFADDKGVSLLLSNTEKGERFISKLSNVEIVNVELEKVMQPCLMGNWPKPTDYDAFWKYYQKHSFQSVVDRYVTCSEHLAVRLARKLKHELGKVYRQIFR